MATSQHMTHTLLMFRTPMLFRALIMFACFGALSACSKPDYHTVDGASGRFADTRGKWLLINYWAEWCKPCIEELPELQRFQQQHRDRVVLLTVNYDGAQGSALQQQITRLAIKLPVLLEDPAPRLGIPRPTTLPTTLIFNPDGKLHDTLHGAQTAATLSAAIDAQAAPISDTP